MLNIVRGFVKIGSIDRTRANISIASIGDNTIIAGVTGQIIRIYKLVLWAQAANTLIFKDGTSAFNGAGFNMPAQGGFTFDSDSTPLVMASGNAFVINLSAGSNVSGWAQYSQG